MTKFATLLLASCTLAAAAPASANLVHNGGFESFVSGGPNLFVNDVIVANTIGATGPTILTAWNYIPPHDPAVWIASPGAADTVDAVRRDGLHAQLWGPGNGSANGLPATSPAGGNYLVNDGDTQYSYPISQTITGLTPGRNYTLGFYWAAGQWRYVGGATNTRWLVTLGTVTYATPVANIPSQGFVPWTLQQFVFTPAAATEVLTFLSSGGPAGLPPSALLDGVTLDAVRNGSVPEPATWATMVVGLAVAGTAMRRRRVVARPLHRNVFVS